MYSGKSLLAQCILENLSKPSIFWQTLLNQCILAKPLKPNRFYQTVISQADSLQILILSNGVIPSLSSREMSLEQLFPLIYSPVNLLYPQQSWIPFFNELGYPFRCFSSVGSSLSSCIHTCIANIHSIAFTSILQSKLVKTGVLFIYVSSTRRIKTFIFKSP